MKRSAISWCDFSGGDLNFVTGCTKVSEGCRFCFAEAIYERFGRDFSKVRIHPEKVEKLLRARWPQDGNVRGPHSKPLLFLCDTGDLFHPDVPADFIIYAFEVMAARRDADWVVLTKRPERMAEVLFNAEGNYYLGGGDCCPNIILGVTAENQEMADQRIPILMRNWVGLTLVSVEPMLGPMDLSPYLRCEFYAGPLIEPRAGTIGGQPMPAERIRPPLDWVICGGESGPKRRPFYKPWASALYAECLDAGVPFFFKQSGGLRPGSDATLGGHIIQEWPK